MRAKPVTDVWTLFILDTRSRIPNPRSSPRSRGLEYAVRERSSCPSCPSWITKAASVTDVLTLFVSCMLPLLPVIGPPVLGKLQAVLPDLHVGDRHVHRPS